MIDHCDNDDEMEAGADNVIDAAVANDDSGHRRHSTIVANVTIITMLIPVKVDCSLLAAVALLLRASSIMPSPLPWTVWQTSQPLSRRWTWY